MGMSELYEPPGDTPQSVIDAVQWVADQQRLKAEGTRMDIKLWFDALLLKRTVVASDQMKREDLVTCLNLACAAGGVDPILFAGFQYKSWAWVPKDVAIVFLEDGTPHVLDLAIRKPEKG